MTRAVLGVAFALTAGFATTQSVAANAAQLGTTPIAQTQSFTDSSQVANDALAAQVKDTTATQKPSVIADDRIDQTKDHELTLYFFASPADLDWSTPRKLTKSALLSHIGFGKKRYPIGHVTAQLTGVDDEGERTAHFHTGMIPSDGSVQRGQVKDGYGLGVLLTSVPGTLEQAEDIEAHLPKRYKKGKVSFLTLKLSQESAQAVFDYVKEYEARNYDHSYGLKNQPLKGEGSGCSAFAASVLTAGGLDFEAFQNTWTQNISIPETLIGDPDAGDKVSVFDLFGKKGKRWAEPGEAATDLFFWDPDKMDDWVDGLYDCPTNDCVETPDLPVQRELRGKAQGIVLDATTIQPPATPVLGPAQNPTP